ncbi:DDE superfamily endonuclease [Phytophthora infestans]|uniref:DDE superfamily endonuclease n=1 Tax=Phytophthora infestans TaxID=4787 RepID=A0A8S9UJN0_PHYIN|nr:DDE superfamily endonuclease [Phytophthora infestans]
MFGRSPSALCLIFRFMVDLIYAKCSKLLALECGILSSSRCGAYAAAVVARGSPIDRCIGFVDGTVRGIARPVHNQRQCYNGHKRKHALKYQGVMAPDGLFIDFYGPVLGRRHDVYLLRVSEVKFCSVLLACMASRTACTGILLTQIGLHCKSVSKAHAFRGIKKPLMVQ